MLPFLDRRGRVAQLCRLLARQPAMSRSTSVVSFVWLVAQLTCIGLGNGRPTSGQVQVDSALKLKIAGQWHFWAKIERNSIGKSSYAKFSYEIRLVSLHEAIHTKIVSAAVLTALLGRSAKIISPVFPYKGEMDSTLLGKPSFAKFSVRAKGCPFTQVDHRMLRPGQ